MCTCATQILAAAINRECMASISFRASGGAAFIQEQRLIESGACLIERIRYMHAWHS